MDTRLDEVVPARSHIQEGGKSSIFLYVQKSILWLAEMILKRRLYVTVPDYLHKLPKELWNVFGIVKSFQKAGYIKTVKVYPQPPDEPQLYRFEVTNGTGADVLSPKKALFRALGESVERTTWFESNSFYQNKTKRFSLDTAPVNAANLYDFAGFTEEQRKNKVLWFDKNTQFEWIKSRELTAKSHVWCPLQLFGAHYTVKKQRNGEPMLRWDITTGAATATSLKEAQFKGILEVIERDAFMITYLNKLSPPLLDLTHIAKFDHDVARTVEEFEKCGLELYAIDMLTDFSVSVIASVIIDRSKTNPAFVVGACASFSQKDALFKSTAEALNTRLSRKGKDNSAFDETFIDREERMMYWCDPQRLPDIEFLARGEKKVQELKHFGCDILKKDYENLLAEMYAQQYPVYSVEISDKRSKKLGLRTVQIVIPQLQPLHLNERFPCFGGKRLYDVPKKLGYVPAKELNKLPHPFP